MDLALQSAILDDGRVIRDELEQACSGMFDCLREGGAVGEVWLHLELESSYAIALSVPDVAGRFPDDGEVAAQLSDQLLAYCEGAYIDEVVSEYEQDNPETDAQRERRLRLALGCLKERLPEIGKQASKLRDLSMLRDWVYDETVGKGETAKAGEGCVNYFGLPWKDLKDM